MSHLIQNWVVVDSFCGQSQHKSYDDHHRPPEDSTFRSYCQQPPIMLLPGIGNQIV